MAETDDGDPRIVDGAPNKVRRLGETPQQL